jgi:hypothetical protein
MPLIPLQLPPGVYRNGTEYQASNRWYDANLVRWVDGTMRPVGGWTTRLDTGVDYPRAALAWRDLSSNRWLAVGSASELKVSSASLIVTDITPADLTAGDVSAGINQGYGGGFYGFYDYGTPRPEGASFSEATTWALDNWGERLVACSIADGRLLEWDLDVGNNAAPISNAPTGNLSLMVTSERFLFALGAGGNPRKVQWCDRENNTVWTPTTTNEAGDIDLQTSGQIMLGIRTRGQSLILTDQDAHTATYQGPPFVYGFERVGSACGVVSRRAAVSVDEGVIWMGQRGFHFYSGGAVQDIPCEVADHVFGGMNTAQMSKVYGVSNQQYNEVWWFYPSASSNENDSYVCFNYAEKHWSIGTLSRTAAVDGGIFRNPIWVGPEGVAYNHETGLSHNSQTVFAESGPISLGVGDNVMAATMLIPDEKTQGDVSATFRTRFYPNDTQRTYGPYSMANPTSVRFTGRQIRMRVEGERLADWRVGVMRLDAKPGGMR